MSWETALFAKLSSSPGVAALVASRIYPEVGPDKAALPFLVYQMITRETTLAQDGDSNLDPVSIQITAWGATAGSVESVRKAVRASLQGAALGDECVGVANCYGQSNLRDDRYHGAIITVNIFVSSPAPTP